MHLSSLAAALLAPLLTAATPASLPALPATVSSGPTSAQESARALLAEIRKEGDKAPARLFESLGSLQDKAGMRALEQALDHLKTEVALSRATRAYRHFAGVSGLEDRALSVLEDLALDSRAQRARAGVKGLVEMGSGAHDALGEVIDKARDSQVRSLAFQPLMKGYAAAPSHEGAARFLRGWTPGRRSKREAGIEFVRAHDTEDLILLWAAALQSKDTPLPVREVILVAAAGMEVEGDAAAAVDDLVDAGLSSPDPSDQFHALEAVVTRERVGKRGLVKQLAKKGTREVRLTALRAGFALDRAAGEFEELDVRALSRGKDPMGRQAAALELARIGSPESLEQLQELLVDEDHAVRSAAIRALGARRRPSSIPPLLERLAKEKGTLRREVHWVLRMLTGLDHGTSPQRWLAWWKAEGAEFDFPTLEEARSADRRRARKAGQNRTKTGFYGLRILSDRLTFIVDSSGSMNAPAGSGKTRLDVAKEQLSAAIADLNSEDRFNVIDFDSRAKAWRDETAKADKKGRRSATTFIDDLVEDGGTAIYDALELAFEDASMDTVYLLSDGDPSGGTYDDVETILSAVRRWNSARRVTIHCIAVGQDHRLLRSLAEDTGGTYKRVE